MPECMTSDCPGCESCMASGGEVMGDDEMDAALGDAAAGELLEALQAKDKAGILEALRAIVLSTR